LSLPDVASSASTSPSIRLCAKTPGGWAYGAIYGSSRERTAALDGWLWSYNHRRPHGSLSHKPPIARLTELNNLPGSYS
jgi:transposase InsO family protein